ncbi:MAG: flagellar basal body-associated FliL family protein [Pseudomonadota bacterium]|nr:flagellar basal body-associated FliL family protein [Pseudomonadota bacterium]
MAKKEDAKVEASAESARKGSGRLLLIVGLVLLLLIGGGAGAALYLMGGLDVLMNKAGGDAAMTASGDAAMTGAMPVAYKDPPQYLSLDPPFVVNFDDQGLLRYVQISVSAMARRKEVIDALASHMPQIRNDLIVLFGNQSYENLNSGEGKERLRQQTLEVIQEIMRKETGAPGVEAVYFTNFVMQ